MTLFLTIVAAILVASFIGACVGLIIIQSNWYLKWMVKYSKKMTSMLMESMTFEEVKKIEES